MEDPRIISALFIFLKMAYYNVLINTMPILLCGSSFSNFSFLYFYCVIRNIPSSGLSHTKLSSDTISSVA
ncbi:hypothetical protein CLONEX_03390, partial [[Clostridium] nexile DSM 1787]